MPALTGRGLYIITDCQRLDYPSLLQRTAGILETGIELLQYRDKNPDRDTRRSTARRLRELCRKHNTPLIINDDVELARETGADGVHLGREDPDISEARRVLGGSAIVGVSCYNRLENARDAQARGADYVAFGAFFPTTSRDRTVPADVAMLRDAHTELSVPIVAIGGITLDNCGPLLEAGADFLAVISAVYSADDPDDTVRRFKDRCHRRG